MKLQHVLAGSAAFAASVYSGYMYAKPMKALPQTAATAADEASGSCAFDRLAGVYDSIIGSEERYMFYGLLRWWLLRDAQGDVLEISAGTGRNLPHYNYSQLSSLTLTDVSQPMLQQARSKYFDELKLQYKQPDVSVKFMLADAEHIVAADGQAPVTAPLPHSSRRSGGSASRASSSSTAGWRVRQDSSSSSSLPGAEGSDGSESNEQACSIWRFKQQKQQQAPITAVEPAGEPAAGGSSSNSAQQAASGTKACSTPAVGNSQTSTQPVAATSSGWWWKAPESCTCHSASAASAGSSSSSSSNGDSSSSSSSTFEPGSFDVVVDMFGLCSCKDPVQVLQQACQLLKPGGKLLLLEHGRSSWDWLNSHMDERAAGHYAQYGCWYNRDILDIVQKAGLHISKSSRWHFGTSYLIVATAPTAESHQ